MRASDLRARYLDYFASHDHKRMPSSPLVPQDPTLLFTSAGMVQFKEQFAGRKLASHPRVTTCQKCFRTTDIENVGRTAFHLTFFEMLGNFSFGDYFKEGAIDLAWGFLTQELRLDPSDLWVSVYQEDDVSFDIWHDLIGFPSDRIVRLGKEHNWWGPAGDNGPCGPDSEIHFDTGADRGCGDPACSPACDCNRFSEIWNLVFMEYDARSDGTLHPLTHKSIDTGMGLERTVTTLQGAPTNFDTDLFSPIIQAIERAAPDCCHDDHRRQRNILADHIRAVVFLLAEGVMPSNERQGYVLRRILRRAIRAGEQVDLRPGTMAELVDPVIESLGSIYPEIVEAGPVARKLIHREEQTFRRTLREGERRLGKLLDDLTRTGEIGVPGEAAFELNDTYGFPVELTREIAADRGFEVEMAAYDRALQEQRSRSRAKVDSSSYSPATTGGNELSTEPTEFVGYETTDTESLVERVVPTQGVVRLAFRQTPFYAEAGGQVTDVGDVHNLSRDGVARVIRAFKDEHDIVLHEVEVLDGSFSVGDRCRLTVDAPRRQRIRRNHTATHLLHAGLRSTLGPHVAQAGSLVNEAELRFDFSHYEKLTQEQIAQVEDFANAAVWADRPVHKQWMSLEQATDHGAIGLFDEEYRGKAQVRVVEVEGISKELCGGTHVSRAGEIGMIKIVSEESIAAGTRRIRAITAEVVLQALRNQASFRHEMSELLGEHPREAVAQLHQQIADLSVELARHTQEKIRAMAIDIASHASQLGDVHLISARADMAADQLQQLADEIEDNLSPAVILLAGEANGRALVVCKVSKAIRQVHAGDVVKRMAQGLGGGGGGAPSFAQGGGPETTRIDAVLSDGLELVRQALSQKHTRP